MAIRDIFKVSRKTFFNPSAWIDLEALIDYNRTIKNSVTGLFTSAEPARQETFEHAMKRLNLSEEDIQRTGNNYYMISLFFAAVGLVLILFSLYLAVFYLSFHAFLIGLGGAGICFAQAFRYNFWYFQIKVRKLGCTFDEWKTGQVNKDLNK